MAEKDSQSNSQEQQPERKFSQEQYEILKRCSGKKDMTEWNEWRKEHHDGEILLEGAKLWGAHLEGAKLWGAHLEGANLREAHLEGADLVLAHLEGAELWYAHLEGASLSYAHLEGAKPRGAHLEGAKLWGAHLEGAKLWGAHLEGAQLGGAHLEGAQLGGAHLEGAKLWEAHLQDARLAGVNLQGADFSRAIVDGGTLIWVCKVDDRTKFEGVGLGNIRIYPETRQLLEYNIRRMNWQEWYKKGSLFTRIAKRLFIQPFWRISKYGLSTWRIIATFFALAVIFATVYFVWGAVDYYVLDIKDQPGVVSNLFVQVVGEEPVSDVHYSAMVYFRSIYFSIVTMTTLGFGDMFANTASFGLRWWVGHLLLIVQVILGYVLLAALVTRFAVLFTAGGPAGEFAEKNKRASKDNK
jgi:uncharacterized protein YjbI with pentapeptide repeats